MSAALIHHTALVTESQRVSTRDVMRVAAALEKHAIRDLCPIWDIRATANAFERLEDVPLGYWPMIVMDDIGFPGAAGIHLDKDGQPFALITSSHDLDEWALTTCHELDEMLVDPFGDRLVPGDSPKPDQGRVLFLVEVCDPSEAAEFGYSVNGILMSDFYTPRFFDPTASCGVRYSFTDAISEPRQVLKGGYLSWLDPETSDWWQERWFGGSESEFVNLGPLTASEGSFRSQIDVLTFQGTHDAIAPGRSVAMAAGLPDDVLHRSAEAKAESLRAQIAKIISPDTSTRTSRSGKKNHEKRRRPKRLGSRS